MRIIDSVEILEALDIEIGEEIESSKNLSHDKSELLTCQIGIKKLLLSAIRKNLNKGKNNDQH